MNDLVLALLNLSSIFSFSSYNFLLEIVEWFCPPIDLAEYVLNILEQFHFIFHIMGPI